MPLTIHHRISRSDLALGLVQIEDAEVGPADPRLGAELEGCIARRKSGALSVEEEALRKGSRDILRNGRYRPTGRGKPASEYLMRAAEEGNFPRINGPVDANNLVSLKHCVAISLWDLDLASADTYEFRLGASGERYVFNPTGQVLELEDLVCGCALSGVESTPIVTPIKDSMATKIQPSSKRLAGCIYYPLASGSKDHLLQITEEFSRWLLTCGRAATGAMAITLPGESVVL
jgi:DNA/RNA-binding domain of Phe-tRNA-synthetase-like protein